MTLAEIEACIHLAGRYGVSEFTVSAGSATLTMRRDGATAPVAPPEPATPPASIRAGAAGVFCGCHPASAVPGVAEGEAVQPGQIVAFLQVGPVVRPVTAPAAGTLGAMLVADGTLVGFGTALFDWYADA